MRGGLRGQIQRGYQEFGFRNTKFEIPIKHLNRGKEDRAGYTNLELRKEV